VIFVLPDQCSTELAPFDDADPSAEAVCMAEIDPATADGNEAHRQRLAVIFAAMRHFRDRLREKGFSVHYQRVGAENAATSQAEFLTEKISELQPKTVTVSEPSGRELLADLQDAAAESRAELDVREDPTFLCAMEDFRAWADGRKRMTMEYFYREQRRAYGYLMNGDQPAGGDWNFDEDNRESFDEAPQGIKAPVQFRPDDRTQKTIADVESAFPDAYGQTASFAYPVTPEEARRAVRDFVEHRLPSFGTYQDAMWTNAPFLYHSRLSAAINLRLVTPRYVLDRAEEAYRDGDAPINAVEGFVRQILGWREFVRGVYWTSGPDYEKRNALNARRELPDLFWTGDTDMRCMSDCIGELNEHAYLHHIQRLMVTGLFGMLYGVKPQAMNDWHLAMYADAWPWVSAPNMVGMSQYADGGTVGTKPYAASGNYINKMSNYCANCSYDYREATGEDACPFTTLYWDFLLQHEDEFQDNPRMNFQMKNVENKGRAERNDIRQRAEYIRRRVREGTV
jgi:deoxyribodipyrimidine photolyase-related protein